jgi:hypothetical protein
MAGLMLRLKHAVRLWRDMSGYALTNGAYWVFPLMILLAVATTVIVATEAAVPFTIYTFF